MYGYMEGWLQVCDFVCKVLVLYATKKASLQIVCALLHTSALIIKESNRELYNKAPTPDVSSADD